MTNDRHVTFMRQALTLAEQGLFTVRENPRVGCVLVKDNKVVATGRHAVLGGPHAEAAALASAGTTAHGCDAYVTLEPCSHTGKTPPCADALITAGIRAVYICNDDPNPLVSGQGYRRLESAGIPVTRGLLSEEGRELNRGFLHRMQTDKPWVRLKQAQSLDGRTAMKNGESYWITGTEARADVQYWRARSDAIITGIDTVLADDCKLTVRPESLPAGYQQLPHNFTTTQPLRVVLDSQLRMPLTATIIGSDGRCVVFTRSHNQEKITQLEAQGVTVITQDNDSQRIDLERVIDWLGEQRMNEVLFECGAQLATSMWQQQLINEWLLYVAPVLLGSAARPTLHLPLEHMNDKQTLAVHEYTQLGNDWRLRITPQPSNQSSFSQ